MATMEEILSNKPQRPERQANRTSDSAKPAQEAKAPEKTVQAAKPAEPAPKAKDEIKPKVEAQPAHEEVDEEDGQEPDSLDGFKRALAAARGDKRKARKAWRDAETKLAEMQGRMQALEQYQRQANVQHQPQPQQAQKTEDPSTEFFADPVKFINSRVEAAVRQTQQVLATTSIRTSEQNARRAHEDYDTKLDAFKAAAQADPTLLHKAVASGDPGEYAYQAGKLWLEASEMGGDPETWREKERQRIRAELEAEMAGGTSAALQNQQHQPKVPKPSLAAARGTAVGTKPHWEPQSFGSIFGGR